MRSDVSQSVAARLPLWPASMADVKFMLIMDWVQDATKQCRWAVGPWSSAHPWPSRQRRLAATPPPRASRRTAAHRPQCSHPDLKVRHYFHYCVVARIMLAFCGIEPNCTPSPNIATRLAAPPASDSRPNIAFPATPAPPLTWWPTAHASCRVLGGWGGMTTAHCRTATPCSRAEKTKERGVGNFAVAACRQGGNKGTDRHHEAEVCLAQRNLDHSSCHTPLSDKCFLDRGGRWTMRV